MSDQSLRTCAGRVLHSTGSLKVAYVGEGTVACVTSATCPRGSFLTLIVTVSKGIPRLKQFQANTIWGGGAGGGIKIKLK